jgi:Domain of Unknown Function (DUF1259)
MKSWWVLAAAAVAVVLFGFVARATAGGKDSLPVGQMEQILQAKGTVSPSGVLTVELDRTDIGTITLHDYATGQDIPIEPSFELNGDLTFQPLGDGKAFFNGDIALKPNEVNPAIDAILANHLVFQAEHQHFYDFQTPVWFIHFRGTDDPLTLAREIHNVVKATATPLPQAPPAHPTTPLNPDRLKAILHGDSADVGDNGVVTVSVPRTDEIKIDHVKVDPDANIETSVVFEPLDNSGNNAAVAPDFSLEASEVNPVVSLMRSKNWDIGCLYNQEIGEQPQLFFSHQIKTGDPYQLAHEVRDALDKTDAAK